MKKAMKEHMATIDTLIGLYKSNAGGLRERKALKVAARAIALGATNTCGDCDKDSLNCKCEGTDDQLESAIGMKLTEFP